MTTIPDLEELKDRKGQMTAIVSEHQAGLLRYAARMTNNASAAEDIVQNVFVKLFRAWEKGMRPSFRMKQWLYAVAHNEAVDYIRREERQRNLRLAYARRSADDCCADVRNACAGDRFAVVLELVGRLTISERQVVLLRLQEGLSYREIAEITGRSVGGVANMLHHAVQRLAELVRAEIPAMEETDK